jgi:hypothetical protein
VDSIGGIDMEALVQLLIACETLLRSVGEKFWANKIQTALRKSECEIDTYLLEKILSWYGGMGSFNDLMISEFNDHLVKSKDEEKLNDELNRLRNQIYQEAVHLKRESESMGSDSIDF